MKTFRLSYEARLDFLEALDHLASHSQRAAFKWENRMVDAFFHLAEWRLTGMVRPEFGPSELRFWIEGEYIVIYDPSSEPLVILGVLHTAQDIGWLAMRRIESYMREPEDEDVP
jgi:plasmid stabilization system protein ParE